MGVSAGHGARGAGYGRMAGPHCFEVEYTEVPPAPLSSKKASWLKEAVMGTRMHRS